MAFYEISYFTLVWTVMYISTVHTQSIEKNQGYSCVAASECKSNLTCVSGTCDCSDGFYYSSSQGCLTKKNQGDSCGEASECKSSLTCVSGICDCRDGFYYSSSQVCLKKRDHGEVCQTGQPSDRCKVPNTVCTYDQSSSTKCLCASGFYWADSSSCLSQNNLNMTAAVTARETRAITFTWTDISHRNDVSYSIKWDVSNMGAGKTGVTVTGLEPGTSYSFTVVTSLPADGNYQPILVSQTQATVWTLPDTPGHVTGSERVNSVYEVTFGASNGSVSQYTMSVSLGGSTVETQTSTSTVMTFTRLKPATTYSYSLWSYNGNSDQSVPVTGQFTTAPEDNEADTTPAFPTGLDSTSPEQTTSAEQTTSTDKSPTVRHDFECHLSYMQVFIPVTLVPNSELTLRDPTCKLNNNGTHHKITFAYDECDTTKTSYEDYIDIKNDISVHTILNGTDVITFVEDYKIPLQCSVDRSKLLNSALLVVPRENIAERVQQSSDFTLKEYTSADYSQEITDYPVQVPLNREIFFEITLKNNSNSSIGVYVEQCQATPSPNPNDTTHITLIDLGCPAHPAVNVQPSAEIDHFRFSTQAFRFSAQSSVNSLVYIHCSVSTCGGETCKHSCSSRSRRRRRRSARNLASTILTSGSHVVTNDAK